MAPIKSSLARSVGKLLGVSKDSDLSIRGATARIRVGPIESSGGTKSSYSGKIIHAFTGNGTLSLSGGTGSYSIEYVVVAGGGAGGRHNGGGGGGAGGYRTGTATVSGPVSVTVGAGGESNSPNTDYPSNDGANSVITGPGSLSITSEGGGGGGDSDVDTSVYNGHTGGSGGGSGSRGTDSGSAGAGNTPPVSPSQGFPGGGTAGSDNAAYREGAGGGGAGGAGGNAVLTNSPYRGGHGGIGKQAPSTFRDPNTPYGATGPNGEGFWFAGGGGGGSYANPNQALGKGGGPGGPYAGGADGGRGATHGTGGGGGGADRSDQGPESSKVGGRGGNGIVLIAVS